MVECLMCVVIADGTHSYMDLSAKRHYEHVMKPSVSSHRWTFAAHCHSHSSVSVRPLTHAPETVAINSTPDSCANFRDPKAVNDVRTPVFLAEVVHRQQKLSLESGVEFMAMMLISGAGFWSVCHQL